MSDPLQVVQLINRFFGGIVGEEAAHVSKLAHDLNIPVVSDLHPDNPGVAASMPTVYVTPTGKTSTDMQQAVTAITQLALKLG